MCAPYLEKSKPTFLPWFIKRRSVHLTETLSNLNRFQVFLHCRNRKNVQNNHTFTYLLLEESVANNVINVS